MLTIISGTLITGMTITYTEFSLLIVLVILKILPWKVFVSCWRRHHLWEFEQSSYYMCKQSSNLSKTILQRQIYI